MSTKAQPLAVESLARLGLALVVASCANPESGEDEVGPASPASFFDGGTLNMAHRGGVAEVPEHTALAYEHALDVGADVLEIDLQLSADGVAVALHDDTVDRTTDGSGAVAATTFDALQTLDAAYRFTLDGETFPHRGAGHRVPRLEDIFDAHPMALFAIEIKPDDTRLAELVAAAVDARGLQDQVFVWSSNPDVTQALRAAPGSLHVGLNFAEQIELAALAPEQEADYRAPGPFAQIPLELNGLPLLDRELVDRAHRHGILVHAWTINAEPDMQMLLDWGVDGIITDRPSTLEALLDHQGSTP